VTCAPTSSYTLSTHSDSVTLNFPVLILLCIQLWLSNIWTTSTLPGWVLTLC